tara:strand:+ start:2425 stop:2760 length:336 start_codon:yes stop_codon:yes gene_type:complete
MRIDPNIILHAVSGLWFVAGILFFMIRPHKIVTVSRRRRSGFSPRDIVYVMRDNLIYKEEIIASVMKETIDSGIEWNYVTTNSSPYVRTINFRGEELFSSKESLLKNIDGN